MEIERIVLIEKKIEYILASLENINVRLKCIELATKDLVQKEIDKKTIETLDSILDEISNLKISD